MPLMHGKSEKAFNQNVRTEMHHDKPLKQSLAIAYAIKRKAAKQHKAMGGDMCAHGKMMGCEMCHGGQYAQGGDVLHDHKDQMLEDEEMASGYHSMPEEHEMMNKEADMEDEDMISRIMAQRQLYSKGGRVANDVEPVVDSEPAQFDDLVKDDHLEADYPGSEEIGDHQEDMDRHDMISRIMKQRKLKDKLPRPA